MLAEKSRLVHLAEWFRSLGGRGREHAAPSDNLEMLMHNSHDLILRLSMDIKLTYVSPASAHIFGVPSADMIGRKLKDYALAEDKPLLTESGLELFSGKTETNTVSFRILRADGAIRWVEVNTTAERDMLGARTGDYVIVLRDITRHRELEAQFAALAMVDGLTGIANRRAFDEALERAWRAACRNQDHLSLLMLDLDHFKTFNDTYGHQAGDDCLKKVARVVADSAKRPDDLAARYGGEELAVILPHTDATGAVDVAVRMLEAVRRLMIPHEKNAAAAGIVSLSIGVATAVMHGGTASASSAALIEAADQALYAAKSGGRNGVSSAPVLRPTPGELAAPRQPGGGQGAAGIGSR